MRVLMIMSHIVVVTMPNSYCTFNRLKNFTFKLIIKTHILK